MITAAAAKAGKKRFFLSASKISSSSSVPVAKALPLPGALVVMAPAAVVVVVAALALASVIVMGSCRCKVSGRGPTSFSANWSMPAGLTRNNTTTILLRFPCPITPWP